MEVAKQYGAFGAAGVLALLGFGLGEWSLVAWLSAAWFVCLGVVLRSTRWGVAATAGLAFACAAYLFWRKLDSSGTSFCSVNETFNCDLVNASAASELFGVPIALLGAGYYLGVVIAAVLSTAPQQRLYQATGVTSLVGLLYCVYLLSEAVTLPAWCLMCLTMYACTGLLFAASLVGAGEQHTPLFVDLPLAAQSTSGIAIAATFLGVSVFGQATYSGSKPEVPEIALPAPGGSTEATPSAPDPAQRLQALYARPRGPVALEGDEPVLGDANAPYQIVEFACFGCPHCAEALAHLQQLVASDPQVQVRFRAFPLSAECNPLLQRGGHPEKCRAAMAAQCANRQGKFWPFASYVFANQMDLGEDLLSRAASEVKLDFSAFSTCMSDPGTLREVEEDAQAGGALDIPGTPTMFLRGVSGDEWVEVCGGAQSAQLLIDAHQAGVTLLPAVNGECPN